MGDFSLRQHLGGFDEALHYLGIADRATAAPYVSRLNPEETTQVRWIIDRHVRRYFPQTVSC